MNIAITGASNGIGYETALLLAEQGHTVFAVARNESNLEKLKTQALKKRPDVHLTTITADIIRDESLKKIEQTITSQTKSLDVLINNSGMLINKPFKQLSSKEWQDIYSTNVFAPVNLIKQLLPLLSADTKKRSHILNISSMGGFQGSAKFKGLSAYSSSKGALAILSECLAEELKDSNISVNCLCLGSVQTGMFSAAFPQSKAATTAEEMAAFIAYFATEGQHFFNGKIIPVTNSTP